MSEKELIVNEEFISTTTELSNLMKNFLEKSTIAASSMRGSRQARKELRAITVSLGKMGKDYRKLSTSFDHEVTSTNKTTRTPKAIKPLKKKKKKK